MTWKRVPAISALFLSAISCCISPDPVAAQDQPASEPAPSSRWSFVKKGKLSLSVRFRFEAFERDGAPFTAPAYAPTLRAALGYETMSYHGFSAFAQGEAVAVTGPADYSVPA